MSDRIEADQYFYQKMVSDKKTMGNISFYQLKNDTGTGKLMSYSVMNGIEIIYSDVKMKVPFDSTIHIGRPCIEITYCLEGNIEVEFKNQKVSYIQSGDISLFNCQTEIKYCDFGERAFQGFSIILYPEEAVLSLNKFLDTDEFQERNFLSYVWKTPACMIYHTDINVEHVCKEIMTLSDSYKKHYLKLKITELLLCLLGERLDSRKEFQYFSKSVVDRTKNIRRFLVENPESQSTIEILAYMEKIEKNTMQKCFKEIYGNTISQYRRRVRMQKGKDLLVQTSMSVTEIAGICGYSNISKFSAAFCNEYGVTPLQFRNQYE